MLAIHVLSGRSIKDEHLPKLEQFLPSYLKDEKPVKNKRSLEALKQQMQKWQGYIQERKKAEESGLKIIRKGG